MSDEDKRDVWRMIEERAQPRPDVVVPDLIRHPGLPGLRVKPVLSLSKRPAMTDPSVLRVEREQDNS
jgi:hypothetical protein